jgi:hypothetical protein
MVTQTTWGEKVRQLLTSRAQLFFGDVLADLRERLNGVSPCYSRVTLRRLKNEALALGGSAGGLTDRRARGGVLEASSARARSRPGRR